MITVTEKFIFREYLVFISSLIKTNAAFHEDKHIEVLRVYFFCFFTKNDKEQFASSIKTNNLSKDLKENPHTRLCLGGRHVNA